MTIHSTETTHSTEISAARVDRPGLRRTTGTMFLVVALAFTGLAAILAATFGWPGILREPVAIILPDFTDGGTTLIVTWFATGWAYALLLVPILLLPTVLRRSGDVMLRVATVLGAVSVVLSLIGDLRGVFVVPALADAYATGSETTRAAIEAAFITQQQFAGVLLGEHLGQLLALAWSVLLSVVILRSRVLPRWLGIAGIVASALFLINQGDVFATAVNGVVTWDLGALIGSAAFGLWIAALGVVLIVRAVPATADSDTAQATSGVDRTTTDAGESERAHSGPVADEATADVDAAAEKDRTDQSRRHRRDNVTD